ncbi:MAG: preprotein translocase subunit SecG [Patescibacteria group bacterium]|jgi:protein translocase SecG subunit|nr:preprotein translocase subunit SecG [Patescibacteria group bacterium]
MLQILIFFQIIISILLLISVLLQNRGSGLSATFGGDFGGFHTKRGIEKFLNISSIVLGALFITNSLLTVLISTQSFN